MKVKWACEKRLLRLSTYRDNDFVLARIFYPGQGVNVNIQSEACRGRANEINTLEHVQVGNFLFF